MSLTREHNGKPYPGVGALRRELEAASVASGLPMQDLTVLSAQHDPYRFDTAGGHANGAWFGRQVADLVRPNATVHLRGLHYRNQSAKAIKPNGEQYQNTDANWDWMTEKASCAGRYLGYVPFRRIVDERYEEPEIFVAEHIDAGDPRLVVSADFAGEGGYVPGIDKLIPTLGWTGTVEPRQPYRIILSGEKTSLGEVLRPLAEQVGGEMILGAGEKTHTRIYEACERAVLDDRPCVILVFADADPSGHRMACSIARKVQALRTLEFHDLQCEVHAVALTVQQCRELGLPESPLKDKDASGPKWFAATGWKQTEIDALAALQPDVLRRIAREAIGHWFDFGLAARARAARSRFKPQGWLESLPVYETVARSIWEAAREAEAARKALDDALAKLAARQYDGERELRAALDRTEGPAPPKRLAIKLDDDRPEPIFDTRDDYVTATTKLRQYKSFD